MICKGASFLCFFVVLCACEPVGNYPYFDDGLYVPDMSLIGQDSGAEMLGLALNPMAESRADGVFLRWSVNKDAVKYQVSINDGEWVDVAEGSFLDGSAPLPLVTVNLDVQDAQFRDGVHMSASLNVVDEEVEYRVRSVFESGFSEVELVKGSRGLPNYNFLWSRFEDPSWSELGQTSSSVSSFLDEDADRGGREHEYRVSVVFDDFLTPISSEDKGKRLAVSKIFSGAFHNCALLNDESLWCWGGNMEGQLGDGSNMDRFRPVKVDLGFNVKDVALGELHSCVLSVSGDVYCWGGNLYYQVGTNQQRPQYQPVKLDLGGAVSEITAGRYHTCALLEDRQTVRCWGSNTAGQIGVDSPLAQVVPSEVILSGQARLIDAGGLVSCALLFVGDLYCWGEVVTSYLPTPYKMNDRVVLDVDVGGRHYFAVSGLKSLSCWGENAKGQCGYGDSKYRQGPTESLDAPFSIAKLTAGGVFSCVLSDDSQVSCWGDSQWSVLGKDGDMPRSTIPTIFLPFGQKVKMLSAGDFHVCALTEDGDVRCWGQHLGGQLGIGEEPVIVSRGVLASDWPLSRVLLWE